MHAGIAETPGEKGDPIIDEAERYHERVETSLANWVRNLRDAWLIARALSDLPTGSSVLDLACGTGRFSNVFLKRGYKLFSMDYSWDMVRYIKRRLNADSAPSDRVVRADASKLPFKDKSLDGMVSFRFLFQHFDEGLFDATLVEGMRVCRHYIFFDIRLQRTSWDTLLAIFGKATRGSKHDRPLPEWILKTEATGLAVERVVFQNRYFSRKAILACRIPRGISA